MHLIKIIGAKEFLQQKIGFFEVEYININSIWDNKAFSITHTLQTTLCTPKCLGILNLGYKSTLDM